MKTTVSEKGQITIPKALRSKLGLETGTILDFTEENGRLIAEKRTPSDPLQKWKGSASLPFGKTTQDYLDKLRDR
ncbi:MAG: AbrB/MazE/SpoVT family DNA-binding domain-containing protein [Verrucomicrobiota bacterium]